jgi:hypothetical protein
MVHYVGITEDEARVRLSTIGTQLLADPDQRTIDEVEAALPPEIRDVRAAVVIPPPPAGDENSGMGAWHVNAETEAHLVVSGEGLVEFMTPDGPVAAVITGGDVMVVRGGEHRYRPLTEQEWIIRHSGGPDAELGSRETGRAASPWPAA